MLVRAENEGSVFGPLPEFQTMYGDPITVKIPGQTRWVTEK